MFKFVLLIIFSGFSAIAIAIAIAEPITSGICQETAELAAKLALGQDINYLSTETFQTQDSFSKTELIYDVYVTEKDGDTYLYFVTLENNPKLGISCDVVETEPIPSDF